MHLLSPPAHGEPSRAACGQVRCVFDATSFGLHPGGNVDERVKTIYSPAHFEPQPLRGKTFSTKAQTVKAAHVNRTDQPAQGLVDVVRVTSRGAMGWACMGHTARFTAQASVTPAGLRAGGRFVGQVHPGEGSA